MIAKSLNRRFALYVITTSFLLLFANLANAATRPLTIALYAPNAGFASGADRFAFVNKLAQQVGAALDQPVQGKAFARASDLEQAIKSKLVDFAVIDGVYLAERNSPYPVMAVATAGGETGSRWSLYAVKAASVSELQGKKLSLAGAGSRDVAFIENALLDGELQVGKFFGSKIVAPDVAAAVAAVRVNKADAVFAPDGQGQGLRKVFDGPRVPYPAFCQVGSDVPADVVAKVRGAVTGHGGSGVFDGWRAGGGEAYRALAARMGARGKKAVMSEPEVVRIEDQDVLVLPSLDPLLPEVRAQFSLPTPE